MRRRQPVADPGADVPPDALRRFAPADWPGSSDVDRQRDRDLCAGTDHAECLAVMDRWRRRRQWHAARVEWCAARGLLDARGAIDWKRAGHHFSAQAT